MSAGCLVCTVPDVGVNYVAFRPSHFALWYGCLVTRGIFLALSPAAAAAPAGAPCSYSIQIDETCGRVSCTCCLTLSLSSLSKSTVSAVEKGCVPNVAVDLVLDGHVSRNHRIHLLYVYRVLGYETQREGGRWVTIAPYSSVA